MQACPRSLDEQLEDLLLGKTERGSDGTGDSKRASAGSDGMSSGQVQSSRLRDAKLRAIRLHVVQSQGWSVVPGMVCSEREGGPRSEAQCKDCVREKEAES